MLSFRYFRTAVVMLGLAGLSARSLSSQTPTPAASSAHVELQIDSATVARFDVQNFDLGVSHVEGSDRAGSATSSAEIRIVKQAGPYSGDLVGMSASGAHAISALIQVMDSTGAATLTIRLGDVTVASDHIALSGSHDALEQQRISLQESMTQLGTEAQQAQRDLTTADELGKSRGATRQEVARAKDRVADVQQRLALGRQRQDLLTRQLRSQGTLDESVIFRFARIEIDSPNPGGHASWEISGRPTLPPR